MGMSFPSCFTASSSFERAGYARTDRACVSAVIPPSFARERLTQQGRDQLISGPGRRDIEAGWVVTQQHLPDQALAAGFQRDYVLAVGKDDARGGDLVPRADGFADHGKSIVTDLAVQAMKWGRRLTRRLYAAVASLRGVTMCSLRAVPVASTSTNDTS
jgi:hypothetical protein